MALIKLIQIVPNLPPTICGVGDHAYALAQSLRQRHGIATTFVAFGDDKSIEASEFQTVVLPKIAEIELLNRLLAICNGQASTAVLLHFSGYSYASRGLCFWLVRALKRFHDMRPDIPIVTMFHELWASGSWLSTAIYAQPLQRLIVRRLINISRVTHTNRTEYASAIHRIDKKKSVVTIPIFSNFGEPADLPIWNARKDQIVLFQPPSYDKRSKDKFWDRLAVVIEKLKQPQIVVAGRTKVLPTGFKLDVRGVLPKRLASQLLVESKYGYFTYYDGYLGKSSLLGGIAAHGVACIMPKRNHSELDGLYSGVHYVSADDNGAWDPSRMEQLGISLNNWYAAHQLSATADRYAETLQNATFHSRK